MLFLSHVKIVLDLSIVLVNVSKLSWLICQNYSVDFCNSKFKIVVVDLWTCYLSKQTNSKVAFLEFLGPLFIQNTSEVIINWCFLRLSSALEEDLCGNERSSAWDHVPTWNAPVLYSICPWTRVSATSWFQSKVKVQMNWIVHGHLCLESESEPFGTIKSTICKPWRLNGSTCRKG